MNSSRVDKNYIIFILLKQKYRQKYVSRRFLGNKGNNVNQTKILQQNIILKLIFLNSSVITSNVMVLVFNKSNLVEIKMYVRFFVCHNLFLLYDIWVNLSLNFITNYNKTILWILKRTAKLISESELSLNLQLNSHSINYVAEVYCVVLRQDEL